MSKYKRLLVVLAILFSGVVLTPYVSLPAKAFGWQLFADAYEPAPNLIHYFPIIVKNN